MFDRKLLDCQIVRVVYYSPVYNTAQVYEPTPLTKQVYICLSFKRKRKDCLK